MCDDGRRLAARHWGTVSTRKTSNTEVEVFWPRKHPTELADGPTLYVRCQAQCIWFVPSSNPLSLSVQATRSLPSAWKFHRPKRPVNTPLPSPRWDKVKDKVHPTIGHEGPEGEKRYSSILSLTSGLDGGWWFDTTPRQLYPRERDPVPIVLEAAWAPEQVWTGAENLAPHRDSIPGPPVL
jgi:hypothetical protein